MPDSTTCAVEWCTKPAVPTATHGLCQRHRGYLTTTGRLPTRVTYFNPVDRLSKRVDIAPNGCWLWTGEIAPHGYGKTTWDGRKEYAHRAMWFAHRGPIPDGMHLDHLCRNRGCVNPDHLEVVTAVENTRRGIRTRATDTHCAQGHPWPDGVRRGSCAECGRIRQRKRQLRLRAQR